MELGRVERGGSFSCRGLTVASHGRHAPPVPGGRCLAILCRYALYGEGTVDTSLNRFGDSYAIRGTVGLRYTW